MRSGRRFREFCKHQQVARVAAGLVEPRHGALDVADALERLADLAQQERLGEQLGDEFLPLPERLESAERMQDPVAQPPRAHRRDRAVERGEQARCRARRARPTSSRFACVAASTIMNCELR